MIYSLKTKHSYCADLFEFGFGLDGLDALLLDVAVGGLPQVVVLDEGRRRLPRQKVLADVVKVLAVLFCAIQREKTTTTKSIPFG